MVFAARIGRWLAHAGLLWSVSWLAAAPAPFNSLGGEYAIQPGLAGDQTHPQLTLLPTGGLLVWQDNAIDGDGIGIGAQQLNADFSPTLGAFQVNATTQGLQENPQVAGLKSGGAVVVWQGGTQGFQKVFARFLNPDRTFIGGDVQVNVYAQNQQINPVVAGLSDGSAVIAWASYGQDGSLQGVYARRFSDQGQPLGPEFAVNQTTLLNQRNPALTALPNGGFAVVWISEVRVGADQSGGERFELNVMGRLFDAQGAPRGNEFRINGAADACANPAVAAKSDSTLLVAWSQKTVTQPQESWDVFARSVSADGVPQDQPRRVNTYTYGDQFRPQVAALEGIALVVWTSLLQDGSWEGVYGQFLDEQVQPAGAEFLVNTTTASKQILPTVAADGATRFLVAWAGFVPENGSFDLFAQRYASAQTLAKPAPPYINALNQSRLSVTWPAVSGFDVAAYELSINAGDPVSVIATQYVLTRLAPGSSHAFRLRYRLTDGRQSPWSDSATGQTWDEDVNEDGMPDDWQALYWGSNATQWPAGSQDSDQDGASNLQEFLAGTSPTDAQSVLRTALKSTPLGVLLEWNTQPGLIYQAQESLDLETWVNIGTARFAAGNTDSLPVSASAATRFYRIIRHR